MKAAIRTLLSGVGLAPASDVAHLSTQSRHALEKVKTLEDRIAKSRAEADDWKRRHDEASKAAAESKQAASRAEASAERATAEAARSAARADEWKTRADALAGQVRDLRAKLEDARLITKTAQEHLMATEVKLDLIESAIQVLDARTREDALARP